MVVIVTGGERGSPLCDRESFTHRERERVCVRVCQEGKYKAIWKSGILTSMAQRRSTEVISMIKWIRTSRSSIKKSVGRQ